ncbi:hypothetical protein GGF46_000519 [Coemansia sp. RSA 552]|nr:hypothetical protein GGF46_000519 [Coemansia sp. RSA 552]
MALTSPCPRFSPNCETKPPLPPGASYDFDNIKDPIDPTNGVLCKTQTPWPQPVAEWTEGQPITVTFQKDGGGHGGGHCQFSLSFDGGKHFYVIHEELRHCFFGQPSNSLDFTIPEYTFNLPKSLPSSDKAIFAWTWVNAIGNREFYMNCADVSIKGSGSSFTGKEIVIANMDGYPTIPEFRGNYDTGLDLYQGSGASNGTGNSSPEDTGSASDECPSEGSSAPGPSTTALYTNTATENSPTAIPTEDTTAAVTEPEPADRVTESSAETEDCETTDPPSESEAKSESANDPGSESEDCETTDPPSEATAKSGSTDDPGSEMDDASKAASDGNTGCSKEGTFQYERTSNKLRALKTRNIFRLTAGKMATRS